MRSVKTLEVVWLAAKLQDELLPPLLELPGQLRIVHLPSLLHFAMAVPVIPKLAQHGQIARGGPLHGDTLGRGALRLPGSCPWCTHLPLHILHTLQAIWSAATLLRLDVTSIACEPTLALALEAVPSGPAPFTS